MSKPKGHWPAGKRRNQPKAPGFESWPAFRAALRRYCGQNRKATALAAALKVSRKSVYTWLIGKKWPTQRRATQMLRWYNGRGRH